MLTSVLFVQRPRAWQASQLCNSKSVVLPKSLPGCLWDHDHALVFVCTAAELMRA